MLLKSAVSLYMVRSISQIQSIRCTSNNKVINFWEANGKMVTENILFRLICHFKNKMKSGASLMSQLLEGALLGTT